MRWLLVEAAWTIIRSKSPWTAALRAWTVQIAQRRGKRLAVVALVVDDKEVVHTAMGRREAGGASWRALCRR